MNPIYKSIETNEPIIQGKITPLSQVIPFLELCYLKLGVHVSLKATEPSRSALLESQRATKAVSNKVLSPHPHTPHGWVGEDLKVSSQPLITVETQAASQHFLKGAMC